MDAKLLKRISHINVPTTDFFFRVQIHVSTVSIKISQKKKYDTQFGCTYNFHSVIHFLLFVQSKFRDKFIFEQRPHIPRQSCLKNWPTK